MSNTISKCYPFLGNFKITSLYGYRASFKTSQGTSGEGHRGLDMAATDDKKTIVSCVRGTVVATGYNKERGNYVIVHGEDGFSCIYQHLSSIIVTNSQTVSPKQPLGYQGATGNVSGAHLHLEVGSGDTLGAIYNSTINPADYLGMQNTSTLRGQSFSGNGFITGNSSNILSTNNTFSSVTEGTSSTTTSTSTNGGYADILLPSGEYYQVREDTAVESDWLFGRRYRVFVDIGGNKAFDVSELRCVFEIVKSGYAEANTSVIQIYNLNPKDENKMIQQGQRVVIEAGYVGSQYGKIFDGQIVQVVRSKENATDYVMTIVAMDNDRYTSYGLINASIASGATARDAVNTLAKSAAVATEVGSISEMLIDYPRGKVLFGISKQYLQQIASSANASYYSEDGKVNIISMAQEPGNRIKSYGPRNGLLGVPSQNDIGISCEVLLDPSLKINTFFHIENDTIAGYQYTPGQPIRSLDKEGIYRVIRLTHRGDTRGNDWTTSVEAVSQAGIIPSMLSASSFYGW